MRRGWRGEVWYARCRLGLAGAARPGPAAPPSKPKLLGAANRGPARRTARAPIRCAPRAATRAWRAPAGGSCSAAAGRAAQDAERSWRPGPRRGFADFMTELQRTDGFDESVGCQKETIVSRGGRFQREQAAGAGNKQGSTHAARGCARTCALRVLTAALRAGPRGRAGVRGCPPCLPSGGREWAVVVLCGWRTGLEIL
ncbi:MAG: hypothetical protein J3K34DRAFT_441850 [Monoraphidium minutum]|nr:MAG: hypothetical protein J3K34DRAFT_441850 [Monoraphidium minutum]